MTKKFFFAVMLISVGCGKNQRADERISITDKGWITYETRIPLDQATGLYMEVSLLPSKDAGEGEFKLRETLESDQGFRDLSALNGRYSSFYAEQTNELMIHLHQSALLESVKRTFINAKDKKVYEENFRNSDVTLRRGYEDELVLVSQNSRQVDGENQPSLVRRTSRPFTVEGYFTHMGDSSVFEEMNTGELWPVSRLGMYDQAIRQYHLLAEKKHEKIYLKGVAYSVVNRGRKNKTDDALVLRRVLQMTSAPTTE